MVLLLDYEQFPFIKILCKNRWTVLYCTLLAKTEGEEAKKEIEEEMKVDPDKAAVLKVNYRIIIFVACKCVSEQKFLCITAKLF